VKPFEQRELHGTVTIRPAAIAGQTIKSTVALEISLDPATPVVGGGLANTAFLQGSAAAGPNALAALTTAIFWIETAQGQAGTPDQLQYTQTVLLNFNGLSWPHITVGALKRSTRVA